MAFILSTLIVQGIYTGLIGGISTITLSACSMVKSIYTHKNPNVDKVLSELDLERRLKLIQTVLNMKESNKKTIKTKLNEMEKSVLLSMVKGEDGKSDDPIELCLTYLRETIERIDKDLADIHYKVAYHNTKWFNSWRTLNIKKQLDALKISSALLDARFNDLIKISNFLSNRNA